MAMGILATLAVVAASGLYAPVSERARPPDYYVPMKATAYVQDSQPTAAGTVAHSGIVAADPGVLPLGSVIQVAGAGEYDGVYIVTDTGRKIRGRHIDIFIANLYEAKEFGSKTVMVKLLERGEGRQDARDKDIPAA